MKIHFRGFEVRKRVALTISRGMQAGSRNWEVEIEDEGVSGFGESAEFSIPGSVQDYDYLAGELERAAALISSCSAWDRQEALSRLQAHSVASSVRAGIDMALWDWCGKVCRAPVWKMMGLADRASVPMSVTIGIQSPASAKERWRKWCEVGEFRAVKVKMGASGGIAQDQAMFEALVEELPAEVSKSVDANGGWTVEEAIEMSRWLSERGVDHIEQPTVPGDHEALARVHRESCLPIMADESCRTSMDIPGLVGCCSGINIKLLKCGGLSEAIRMVYTARSHGLRVMLGCYSQSSLGNAAANQISALVDYVDLDSHLNLLDDPYSGCRLEGGYLVNSGSPGLGVTHA